MIKLKDILSEIKLINAPTSKMVLDLVRELSEESMMISDKVWGVLTKYGLDNFDLLNTEAPYDKLNRQEKINIYQDLLNVKNNINEIKIIKGYTPEMVEKLFDEIDSQPPMVPYKGDPWPIMQKYLRFDIDEIGWDVEDLKRLSQQQLNNLYKELKQLL